MPLDLSRQTFRAEHAPRWQYCSCGCRQAIEKGALVYVRAQVGRGSGSSRILDLEDHYRAWLEKTARQYAAAQAASDPEFARYLGGQR